MLIVGLSWACGFFAIRFIPSISLQTFTIQNGGIEVRHPPHSPRVSPFFRDLEKEGVGLELSVNNSPELT
jgi:hypothetical protein